MTSRRWGAALVVLAAASACGGGGGGDRGRLTLLFFERSPAAWVGGRSWAPDPANSRLVAFDARLRPAGTLAGPELSQPVAVSPLGERLLVTELTGDAVVLDTAGQVVREWAPPFAVALYAGDQTGTRVAAVRSPYRVPALLPEPETAALIRVLDTLGTPLEGLAAIRVPEPPFLTQFANAGAVALGPDGAVFFAPLIADEIRRYDRSGALVWTTRRGLEHVGGDPRYLPMRGGELPVAHAVANVALVVGPGGRLYVLGAEDSSGTRRRVDVLDPATGTILHTERLDSTETAVALRSDGALLAFDAARLAAGAAPVGREPFAPAFALPDLRGDTVRLGEYRGKVTLVNFWASWCDPCREEFPHMAALYRDFDRRDFDIAAISDDVDRAAMRAFVQEFRPPFPILVGGGRMKQTYHYRGLPYSVLLDRHGRIIERIFGFGGPRDFARLRETIAKEVTAP